MAPDMMEEAQGRRLPRSIASHTKSTEARRLGDGARWAYALAAITALVGCSTVPTVLVERPWSRVLATNEPLPVRSRISIRANGTTSPLTGSESLLQGEIVDRVRHLLERRGFVVTNQSPSFVAEVTYRTEQRTEVRQSLMMTSHSYSVTAGGDPTASALGVIAAGSVAVTNSTTVSNVVTNTTQDFFRHTIAIDIRRPDGDVVWKGEAQWDQWDVDILRSSLDSSLQYVLSELPRDEGSPSTIRALKEDRIKAYLRIVMGPEPRHGGHQAAYACPALPFHIEFRPWGHRGLDPGIENPDLLPAFIDLMHTAEFALPTGGDYSKPLDIDIWSDVELGGTYLIAPSMRRVNLLIRLTGQKSGYAVDRCWEASDSDYAQFQQKMSEWRQALAAYYDVYQ